MIPVALESGLPIDKEDSHGKDLASPFPPLPVNLTDEELRETAYEVFLNAYGPVSRGKHVLSTSTESKSTPASCFLGNVFTLAAIGCCKRASPCEPAGTYRRLQTKSMLTEIEVMRIQMDITEKGDARARRALAKQNNKAGGNSGALLVPLQLLRNLNNSSEFSSHAEHEHWQRRQLKILEAEMLIHPASKTVGTVELLPKIQQAVQGIRERRLENGRAAEALQNLQDTCTEVSGEAFGYPLNVHLYKMLLLSLFDSLDESCFAENCETIMMLVKKTWGILGIEQPLHSICFMWIVFRQFVVTEENEANLLKATETVMREVIKPLILVEKLEYRKLLESALTSILGWVETGLLDYWDRYSTKGKEVMDILVRLAVLGTQILHELGNGAEMQSLSTEGSKLEKYVQSSLQSVFLKICKASEKLSEVGKAPPLALIDLATTTEDIALEEQQKFSPSFKLWLPHAASVAARTLHTCYRMELKQFLSNELIPTTDVVKVLQSAAKLEKMLMKMIMQDEAQPNSTGIHDHQVVPFASDAETAAVLKKWLKQRLEQLQEWSSRNIKQETWTINARREQYASSAVELLRIVDETSDAFFKLPVSQNLELLQDFSVVLDGALYQYVHLVVVGCGDKEDYFGNELLSRCKDLSMSIFTKLNRSWRKTFEPIAPNDARVWPELNDEGLTHNSGPVNLQCLCIRINTLYQILTELEFLEKKVRYAWQELPPDPCKSVTPVLIAAHVKFEGTRVSCQENIKKLCDIVAFKVVYGEMKGVFWDGLYLDGVPHARIGPILEELNIHLEIIAEIVSDRLRNQVVNHLMMACYDCFLQVIFKESSSFSEDDVVMLKEDLTAFKDLFISNGEGLPEKLVEEAAEPVNQFLSSLPLKTKDSPYLGANIEARISTIIKSKTSAHTGQHQRSASSNTLSSVLGHTCHVMASNLVMRTYSLARR
ncbi:hypothetical protein O6H91_18G041000 [Diphasiastrum complanatum]|uniref:Uncharacterized protein n=4 Tax=Diphasiastrum complanatum TaxID=34168 RepID=A0ACC2B0B6_DIPCM|nr:hypothetical protein O6H91_18G041000 [Diphasiastrum complanatum]KAJ7523188.1 hypothetical protein O6H91_18G041000 [Diphasiastrum complanatum]KAJ7523189.1 hypothetical protein O6H91_18G041000 [Diphasiastrum complanatum]KAJ7523190.1 hypothetical protein O6H91_18G041000 [Diphasiastrum complanatum]